jgi:hypothetical protein
VKRGAFLGAALCYAAFAQPSAAVDVTSETVWLSAPILPKIAFLGGSYDEYPIAEADREQLARDMSLTYDFLLENCGPEYAITRWQEGDAPLSPSELYQNYEEIARCSYEQYVAKPYWSKSHLIDDIDVCATVLGAPWRMPTEADVASFSEADFEHIQKLLTVAPTDVANIWDGSSWGETYFSLKVFVRGNEGYSKLADLRPGVQGSRFSPNPHGETIAALRCIARAPGSE